MSVRDPRTGFLLDQSRLAEREAVRLLLGVGGEVEWWIYAVTLVGHLRVAITPAEHQQMPPGCVVADAGYSGPQRPRTRR